MKMTIVTSARGKVIASVEGHVSSPSKRRGMTAIIPEDGQKFHEVEVPAAYAKLESLALLKALTKHVKR